MRHTLLLAFALFSFGCASDGISGPGDDSADEDSDLDAHVVCAPDQPFVFGETLEEVTENIEFVDEISTAEIDKLNNPKKGRIVRTATHLGLIAAGEGLEAAVDTIDEDTFEIVFLEFEDAEVLAFGHWYRYRTDGAEVGVIFNSETLALIADTHGDTLRVCEPKPAP